MKRFIVGFIPLSFMVGLPVIAGRMACGLAAMLLICASVAQGQVIEEGGFPVKGGGVSGEAFSLSCPPRLYVEAGESVSLSCSATAVPEEGVRYAWEPVSGDGFHLLSDAQALTPLFTAPLSGEGVEYVYRLTAMSVGVYETATVTVSVEGVPEETVSVPVVQEECDSLVDFEGGREGCVPWDKAPPQDPFGGIPEDEGIVPWPSFPEDPGAEEKEFPGSSGGGSFPQTPPRLECPVAVFLEELETGQLECHAWDAAGEEYLDYSWEPVGSTTRDYLDNPRLIPEDSPTPSVVAPETPVYETLESFRSGETTFRYRYRLTATSRATGLSSSSEVEVFVSSSRPGVYCPLEEVVEEEATITLDCEGIDPLSGRMDYDENGASIEWEWEGLWGTSMAPLDATDRSSPLFTAPVGSAGEEYHYIASMTSSASGVPRTARRKVTVRVVGKEDAEQAPASKANAPSVTCEDAEIYEATEDFTLDCSATDTPSKATYAWKTRGGTSDTGLLTGIDKLGATFSAPENVDADTDYEYTVTMLSPGIGTVMADITVTVKNKPAITVRCDDSPYSTKEGPDISLGCVASGGADDATYTWSWSPTDRLMNHASDTPTFDVPGNDNTYQGDRVWTYMVTASADGADAGTARVSVTVKDNVGVPPLACFSPYRVDEGSVVDITISCAAFPAGNDVYDFVWTAHGDTPNTSRLDPTSVTGHRSGLDFDTRFTVPDEVDGDEIYTYTLTASRPLRRTSLQVAVVVKETYALTPVVSCTNPVLVYEGSDDFPLTCAIRNAPESVSYSWSSPGAPANTSLLSATDILSPTFDVPENVDANMDYVYLLTASADGEDDATAEVTVTVLNRVLAITCTDPSPEAYEGEDDITLACSASGAAPGVPIAYVWSSPGAPADTSLLSATDVASPAFDVPENVDSMTETYEYLLTATAENATAATATVTVTVTVLNKPDLSASCTDSSFEVYERDPDFRFDCLGLDGPQGTSYQYLWTPRGDTPDVSLLRNTTLRRALFVVPDEVPSDTTFEYTLTVSAANANDGTTQVTVRVLDKSVLSVACTNADTEVYEGAADFSFDCTASGVPSGSSYTYAWTGNAAAMALLDVADDETSATFLVPPSVSSNKTYEYTLTVSAAAAHDAAVDVEVTVLNKSALSVACTNADKEVYEGAADITFGCTPSGAPGDNPEYTYAWTGDAAALALLDADDIASPTFAVPDTVSSDKTYEYTLTVSAENADDATAEVTVTVLNKKALSITCTNADTEVYEGAADITFGCTPSGAPSGSSYTYAWTGDAAALALLDADDIASPTFAVPDTASSDKTYEYTLTVSAENAGDATAEVIVTVLNKKTLFVFCAVPASVFEDSEDITFNCDASGAPSGSSYAYAWSSPGARRIRRS